MSILLKPYASVPGRCRASGCFYLPDCNDVFSHLPAASIDVIVTSPP